MKRGLSSLPNSLSSENEVSSQVGERPYYLALWCAVGLYVFLVLRLVFHLHDSIFGFRTGFDVAIFDQATWLISQGKTPFVTVRGVHLLSDHFSVILYLLAPLYWLWPDPRTLLAVQTLALAAGAFPVFALAKEQTLSPPVALIFAIVYLLYPALHWSNTYEFHPDTLATPLFLAAFLFFKRQQWRFYFAALFLAALTKESMGLTIMAFGIYACFLQRRIGFWTIGLGLASLIIALKTIRYFNSGVASGYYWLYAEYGDTLPQMALYILSHPVIIAEKLFTGEQGRYLFDLLQPLLFLPLLAPEIALVALPVILINTLSMRVAMHNLMGGYYAAAAIPFLFSAAIQGYRRARQRLGGWGSTALAVNLVLWSAWGTFQGGLWAHYQPKPPAPQTQAQEAERIKEIKALLSRIPRNASVSAQSTVSSQLTHRTHIYTFPNPFFERGWGNTIKARRELEKGDAAVPTAQQWHRALDKSHVEYIVLCPFSSRFPLWHDPFEFCVLELLRNRSYGLIAIGQNTLLFQRGADYRAGIELLRQRSGLPKAIIQSDNEMKKAFRRWMDGQPKSL